MFKYRTARDILIYFTNNFLRKKKKKKGEVGEVCMMDEGLFR